MTLALAHSRGRLDYEERVSKYWPEFAQNGKEKITVRQLMAHQAGLFALDEPLDRSLVGDLDCLAGVLARQKPAWEPGTRQGYHAVTLGFYDECMKGEVRFSLGFMKPCPTWPFGSDYSFGAPGAGGSLGFADPEAGVGYAYVTNRMGTSLTGDPRVVALRDALYSIISSTHEGREDYAKTSAAAA
jgi:CubicO group peptidase (beta-lactamase class C family)